MWNFILVLAIYLLSRLHFCMFSDTILKKYSSTVATIFTGIASAALFGHVLTMNFLLGISIVFISMHQVKSIQNRSRILSINIQRGTSFSYVFLNSYFVQFFSPLAKVKDEQQNGNVEIVNAKDGHRCVFHWWFIILSIIPCHWKACEIHLQRLTFFFRLLLSPPGLKTHSSTWQQEQMKRWRSSHTHTHVTILSEI